MWEEMKRLQKLEREQENKIKELEDELKIAKERLSSFNIYNYKGTE